MRVSEKAEQQAMVQLLRTIGATVYVLGTVRRKGDHPGTMQTPGICDVFAFLPASPAVVAPLTDRRLLAIEVKAQGGRLSPAQREFRGLCELANVDYLTGGRDDLIAWLEARQYLRTSEPRHVRGMNA